MVSYPFLDLLDEDFLLLLKLQYASVKALLHFFNLLFGARGGLLGREGLLRLQDDLWLLSTLCRGVRWRNVGLIAGR